MFVYVFVLSFVDSYKKNYCHILAYIGLNLSNGGLYRKFDILRKFVFIS